MKRKHPTIAFPLHDYHAALQGLAAPVPRLNEERAPYFAEPRRWHPSVVAGALYKVRN